MDTLSPTTALDSVRLLTIQEIATWARVHPKTVYRWIRDGKLPAIQLGIRTVRVPEAVVESFLKQMNYIGQDLSQHAK